MDKNTEQKLKRIWCERLIIGLFASTALGFLVVKIPTVYSQKLANDQAQVQSREAALVEQAEVARVVAVPTSAQVVAIVEQAVPRWAERAQAARAQAQAAQVVAQVEAQALQQQLILLGISALCFILMLLLLLRRNQISLPFTGQLIIVLPEEYIVELEAFHQQIKFEKRSIWVIRKIMLWTVLELLWAFHIQINVENLWLPKSRGHNKIDD
ncbi:hypothetical protein GNF10_32895 [Nostoc sp. UCD121]|uniref:hypothetical protein n=1 Tax=unclassified Nostoc TaxID=2593658 RepID=UPI0016275052|nr:MULTISPECIES: hypothetical protein [unclassified Nostoc]MBC1225407.1 hypothetical protein [Nostoc sp. UCD120]MBC1280607.1 hypothetical protein [Nostoc sp. UCD121]